MTPSDRDLVRAVVARLGPWTVGGLDDGDGRRILLGNLPAVRVECSQVHTIGVGLSRISAAERDAIAAAIAALPQILDLVDQLAEAAKRARPGERGGDASPQLADDRCANNPQHELGPKWVMIDGYKHCSICADKLMGRALMGRVT